MFNQEEFEILKKDALENHIPIIMDDTLEVIKKVLEENKPKRILEIGTAVGYSAMCFSEFLDENGKMAQKWTLNLKVPAPGECKDCHGTHKCRNCNGRGTITNHRTHEIYSCDTCKGTGICQTCFVPMRNPQFYNQDYSGKGNNGQQMSSSEANRQRKINSLRQRIYELQAKIEKAEWDERLMRLRGTDISSIRVYRSQLNLKYQYEKQILQLKAELQQLEENY